MIIDDLIVLGRGAPDRIKDGRITVCTAGYSPKNGFIRIYPTRIDSKFKMWDIIRVPVTRNPKDTREESWKIEGSKTEWEELNKKIMIVGRLADSKKLQLIDSLKETCTNNLNENKRSLGIVEPKESISYFSDRADYEHTVQLELGRVTTFKTKKHYLNIPRIKYSCFGCNKIHDQQIIDWGCYEWIRKYPDKKEKLWDNLLLKSDKHKIYFFVGNQAYYRRSFLIITVLRIAKHTN